MKVLKKICVFLLIGFLCCSSVVISYQKANSCKAVSIGVGITAAVLLIGIGLYGCYYVSDPENREDIKESMTNYAEMTEENVKWCYETNKQLFNDFCDYVTENGGGSTAVYTATGQSYTVNEMKEQGFPSFDEWDSEMKKQGSPTSSGGFGSIWDKLSFGLDLLDFICDFFDDGSGSGTSGPYPYSQHYFDDDDGYIDRETGEVFAFLFSDRKWYCSNTDYFVNDIYRIYLNDNWGAGTQKRIAVFVWTGDNSPYSFVPYENDDGTTRNKLYRYKAGLYAIVGTIGSTSTEYLKGISSYSGRTYESTLSGYDYVDLSLGSTSYFRTYYSCKFEDSSDVTTKNIADWDFVSSKLPIFDTMEHAKAYICDGSLEGLLNGVPEATPTPVPTETEKPLTAVDIYCNYWGGRSVVPSDVVNTNYIIANDWDGTTENLTIILNDSDDEPTVTPGLTTKPIPTLVDDDGSNTTNNYIISITNILQPIQTTVNNIYNFFIIDTEQVKNSVSLDFVPTANFKKMIDAFDKMAVSFGADEYEYTGSGDDTEVGVIVDGVDLNGVATSQILKTDYPVISIKCPKILEDYVDTEVDGQKAIIICDFEDFAVYFVRFRQFINAVLWLGMLFYIMREVRVTFIIH